MEKSFQEEEGCQQPTCSFVKVTVQFETEGSGQHEIFIHMDRSEVKP